MGGEGKCVSHSVHLSVRLSIGPSVQIVGLRANKQAQGEIASKRKWSIRILVECELLMMMKIM